MNPYQAFPIYTSEQVRLRHLLNPGFTQLRIVLRGPGNRSVCVIQVRLYHGRNLGELPPHIYTLAEACYSRMIRHLQSQCCIIRCGELVRSLSSVACRDSTNASFFLSGESGAGKTESTKLILKYLAAVSSEMSEQRTERLILESNPILEGKSPSQRDVQARNINVSATSSSRHAQRSGTPKPSATTTPAASANIWRSSSTGTE